MSFRADINKAFERKVTGLLDKVVRKVALDIHSGLQAATPVDTGRARSNWIPSINLPSLASTLSTSGSPIMNFAGYKLGMKIFIANNLPYIKRLNDGYSKQAPKMFVETVIQRNVAKIKEAVRSVRI
jgi:hypothetical protein